MRNSMKLVMNMLGGGGGVVYLYHDEFTSDVAAGAVNGTLTEPGGQTRTVVDTNSVGAISGGRFRFNGSLAANDRMITGSFAHAGGRAFGMVIPTRANVGVNLVAGVASAATGLAGVGAIRFVSASALRIIEVTTTVISSYTLGANEWCLVFVERPAGGGLLFLRNGTTGAYKLLMVFSRLSVSGFLRLAAGNGALTADVETDDWEITDLSGNYATDFGLATNHIASPTDGQTTTQTADAHVEVTWTPGSAETLTLLFRRLDDDNCLKLVCDQAGGTIKLFSRTAGVDTELDAGKTQTWTVGTAYRVYAWMEGTQIYTFTSTAVATLTVKHNTTSSVQQSSTGVMVSGSAAIANLATWGFGGWLLPTPF